MDTPIIDFVKKYVDGKNTRLHMPGHKGALILGMEDIDVTEFDGADCLYSANGIIKKSRENASTLFGANTFYSAEGSSLCIRAMLYLALKNRKNPTERPTVIATRNAHKTFVSAVGLLDIDVKWIYPENSDSYLTCSCNAVELDKLLSECKVLPIAVYITSPDYLGNVQSIKEISKVCKKYGVLLLVDNAHGAYLKFLPESLHPIDLGADMCCDSAHKTLPALTGSAYLHLSKNLPKEMIDQAEHALSVFGSTSPSYLILQSLDAVNAYIANGYKEKLNDFIIRLSELKNALVKHGYEFCGSEPLKLTIKTKAYGYTGIELNEILKANGIFVEFYDPDLLVMMFTPESSAQTLEKVKSVLLSIPRKTPIQTIAPTPKTAKVATSIKIALQSPSKNISVNDARGRILADLTVNCPPAVPIVVCGEIIDDNAIACFNYYGVKTCSVVKE